MQRFHAASPPSLRIELFFACLAGIDRQMSIWDVRTFQPLHSYVMHRPCTALDISQRGLLACGFGRCLPPLQSSSSLSSSSQLVCCSHVEVWKDSLSTKQKEPYLSHHYAGTARYHHVHRLHHLHHLALLPLLRVRMTYVQQGKWSTRCASSRTGKSFFITHFCFKCLQLRGCAGLRPQQRLLFVHYSRLRRTKFRCV